MVVLDEHQIVEADAMVASAAAGHGVFLEAPPTGRGFARVENLRVCSANCRYESGCERRHARKPLNEIERHAFSGENGPRRAGNLQQSCALSCTLAIAGEPLDFDCGGKLAKGGFGEFKTSHDEWFAGAHECSGRRGGRHGGERGRVAAADVLVQRGANGAADFFRCGALHGASMVTPANTGKKKEEFYL